MFIFYISMSCYCTVSQFSSSRSNIFCVRIAFLLFTIRSGAQKSNKYSKMESLWIFISFVMSCVVVRRFMQSQKGRKGPSHKRSPVSIHGKSKQHKVLELLDQFYFFCRPRDSLKNVKYEVIFSSENHKIFK